MIFRIASLASLMSALILTSPVMAQTRSISATLGGQAEVPFSGEPLGKGTAQVVLKPNRGQVCFSLKVMGIGSATAAHIHQGRVGQNGRVVVGLVAPRQGISSGCVNASPSLISAILSKPYNYYVNVHTFTFPSGAIRGQLTR